ncbi:MAG: rhlE3, partial [Ramlibacter sp.]|nr:rhlE3 [Ramlibacter sp.]
MTDFIQDSPVAEDATFAPIDAAPASVEATPVANGFVTLGLAPELIAAVTDLGFTQPTTVQQQCIGLAMAHEHVDGKAYNDLMVSSQTGSGKTAAFLLPVLHTLLAQQAAAEQAEKKAYDDAIARGETPPKRVRKNPLNPRTFKAATPGALVLCPTRELAQQVCSDAIDLVKHCRGLRIANVVGGMPYQMQIARLQNADLVV